VCLAHYTHLLPLIHQENGVTFLRRRNGLEALHDRRQGVVGAQSVCALLTIRQVGQDSERTVGRLRPADMRELHVDATMLLAGCG
jgi:hypothetical protein